ncbi:MAG: aryldialkylphosphatase [Microbacteriaceae bacterium]|jgi:phosphotriesterase-related protein|nr:aryldialkylphosphatase [Microbacteriaceae bacterium]
MTGTIRTVLGDIDASDLGVTMTHEHCLVDLRNWFIEPTEASRRADMDKPIEMSMLGEIRRRQMSTTRSNLILSDEEIAVQELGHYTGLGGGSIVDASCIGIGRDPVALQRISRKAGLNIVMGTGFYVDGAHPDFVKDASIDELAQVMIDDIEKGSGPFHVKAGVIGEVGISGIKKGDGTRKTSAITDDEEKSLRASARAAIKTGVAVSVHTDIRPPLAAPLAVEILEDEGLPVNRMIIGHLDQVHDFDYTMSVAERGAYVQYDAWGREYYREEWGYGIVMGQDIWRADYVKRLIDEGFGDHILFAQDVCFKSDLRTYGGYGYGHILKSIVPMLEAKGVSPEAIQTILVDNPARALTLAKA